MNPRTGDIQALWREYLTRRSHDLRNKIVEHYSYIVHTQAARLAIKLPSQITYEELCSAGYDGLLEAVQSYDPNRKAKFETFCQPRIIGAVMDWLRSLDPQSRTVRTFEKKRLGVQEKLETELGHRPTHDEIARQMNVPQEYYDRLCRISQLGREVHFSALDARNSADSAGRSSEKSWDVGDTRQDDPSAKMARSMLIDFVSRGLNKEERLVITLYYYEQLTMAEIGAVLDLSESRVSQIHKEVLHRLRTRYRGKVSRDQLVA